MGDKGSTINLLQHFYTLLIFPLQVEKMKPRATEIVHFLKLSITMSYLYVRNENSCKLGEKLSNFGEE